ncbi:Phosphomevalonate kinase [Seminavis robusta]|uniref:phosphomevalonate kinase n=1 Tax=Seminavis robusta TaxID=568900 RepID=A0A9N8EKW4_9STRA|nr:Phosphomevalonate kinase [Seminavis robusta]|eukprot:Sro1097_g240870.1 Phosphomevalonate kinase (509) ;mRNA; r:20706-22232
MTEKIKTTSTTVSAPGKILLAGGYTVLESPNVGVVLAVDKKFYSTVVKHEPVPSSDSEPTNKKPKVEDSATISVHSPQFGATWKYNAKISEQGLELTPDADNKSTNPFVEKSLRITLCYLVVSQQQTLCDLEITILADNDFYSVTPHLKKREWEATAENLAKLPKFLPCNLSSGSLQKTGLGSSAALTTSLVGALVLAMTGSCSGEDLDAAMRRKIHNLAQICHCHAQGKVGSGFDVSSASYGSHVYQRFPKCLLSDLLQELDKVGDKKAMPPSKVETLQKLVDENPENFKWPVVQKPLSWNTDLLQIMLADVSGGSESPSMARKILSWKAASDDVSCWTNLLQFNQQVVKLADDIVAALDGADIGAMTKVLSQCKLEDGWNSSGSADEKTAKVGNVLCDMRKTLLECRKNLKSMGDLAGVPVEPAEQTALADATMALSGVVASLVPGAGGYDALVVVYVNTPEVRDNICDLWRNYKALAVCPLAVQYAKYGEGVNYVAETPPYKMEE